MSITILNLIDSRGLVIRTSLIITVVYGCVSLLLCVVCGAATTTMDNTAINPHADNVDCGICHVLPKDELLRRDVASARKDELKGGPVEVCRQCHGIGFGHGVGKKPGMNRANLPLTASGTITCALTCHNIHLVDAQDARQKQYFLRLPSDKLCYSCHDK